MDTPRELTARCQVAETSPWGGTRGDETAGCAVEQMISLHQLRVVYQPIVDLRDGTVLAYEVLARSDGPESGGPRELFEQAVCSGCCGALGRAVRQLATSAAPDLPLFMNAHPKELGERWLWEPEDPIYHHGPPVHLEITESAPLRRFEACRSLLDHLRGRGIHAVIDDLGAGFSNLRHLAILRPSFAKLDRSLVRGLTRESRMHRLVSSIVELCAGLDIQVVAEGIETEAEADAVRATGAPYGQGYLFAKPAFPAPAVAWSGDASGSRESASAVAAAAPPSHVRVRGDRCTAACAGGACVATASGDWMRSATGS